MRKEYYTYITTNAARTVLYIGVTSNIEYRMYEHKKKVNKGFTEKYNVSKLVYYEEFEYVDDAIFREKQLKRWHREWKENLIRTQNPHWRDLSADWNYDDAGDPETSSG
ncbi:GIY-YIG nuclease family protein [Candidatus Peregrinibacteria bacterium]|nr:GIY-YIG nuclease family protein [Candidatus Peregrinibacteria bacterium]